MKFFLNPALLYSFLWMFLLILYELRLSNRLIPLSQEGFLFFVTSICMFLSGYLLFSFISNKLIVAPVLKLDIYREWVLSRHTTKVLKFLTMILIVGLIGEMIYFQNLPLISLLGIGREMRYTDFGVHGLHGLLNAVFLVILTLLFLKQLFQPTKFNFLLIVLAFSWPILLVTRQLFISSSVDLMFIYLLVKRVDAKAFFKIIIFLCVLVFIFGYVGDLRTGRDSFIALASPTIDYPDYLPSGLLWVYLYMESPLSNVVYNMDVVPYYAPVGTISSFIPSFARNNFIELMGTTSPVWELPNEFLNVSTMHQKFLMDYGPYMSNVFYFWASFFFCFIVQRSSKDPRYGLALVVILHGILLSFFADFFCNLVFVAQFIIYIYCFKRSRLYA